MQQPIPLEPRRNLNLRRTALCLAATIVLTGSVVGGGEAAFAVGDTTFDQVSQDFQAGTSQITLGGSVNTPTSRTSTLALATGATTTLDLAGNTLAVQGIQLTSGAGTSSVTGASLTVVDSVGGGQLIVDHSSGSSSTAAIQVDGGAVGSTFTVSGAAVTATASTATNGSGAAIGGGTNNGLSGLSGLITLTGYSNVTATGSARGAAIGDGGGAAGAQVLINDHAHVTATAPGSAAAIGGGSQPTGSGVGTPTVTVTDYAVVTAASSGSGAAIGGGLNGGGGSIGIHRFAQVTANTPTSTGETGIGDGDGADAGYTSNVTIDGSSTVTAYGGSAGGAAIGGALGAYGNDVVNIGNFAVVVASAANGPGIGATKNRAGTTVSITDTANVTATGGGNGAAVGGGDSYSSGFPSIGSALTVGAGARLAVSSAPGISAIGAGTGPGFGSLTNSGTLTLSTGSVLAIPTGASASNANAFVNNGTTTINGTFSNTGTITNGGAITGNGTLDNQGTVLQNGTLSTSSITGNNFDVNYDPQAGTATTGEQRVYAPSVSAAGLTLPSATPTAVGTFTGWNASTDGTGATLRSTSGIVSDFGASSSSDGRPVVVRAYAQYQLSPVLPTTTSLAQGVVGTAYSATVAATSGTAPITYAYTGSLPAGLVFNTASGAISGMPTTMGTFTMHVTATNALTSTTHDYTIQVVPAPITVTVPTTAKGTTWYLAGGVASLRIGGLQANETYTVKIGGTTAATGKAASNAAFTKKVTIPKSIGDGSQTVSVSGGEHASAATARILTASVSKSLGLKLSAKKVRHGKKITITVSKLYAGEAVRVVISGKHGKTAVGKATSKGGYVLTLKSGLAKGKYTVTVTGAGTSRKASATLTVS